MHLIIRSWIAICITHACFAEQPSPVRIWAGGSNGQLRIWSHKNPPLGDDWSENKLNKLICDLSFDDYSTHAGSGMIGAITGLIHEGISINERQAERVIDNWKIKFLKNGGVKISTVQSEERGRIVMLTREQALDLVHVVNSHFDKSISGLKKEINGDLD